MPLRRVAVAISVSLLLALGAGASAQARLRTVALGVSVLDDQSLAAVEAHQAAVGRYPAIWAVWSDWGGPDRSFPGAFLKDLKARGIVPMVNWQPVAPGSADCTKWSLNNILNGDYDAYIRQWALDAKAYGGTVIVRFAHEMNGYWFTWGYSRCGNTPAKFRSAWKHVWDIFRGPSGVGASNVKFLWSIYGAFKLKAHYPGDKYVNYVGFTGLNWGPTGNNPQPWRAMVTVFKPSIAALNKVTTKKRIIAAEMGASDVPGCAKCDKAAWITAGYPKVYAKWPRLAALVYFDIDMRFVQQPNWRLDSPLSALAAYRQVVADARFQGKIK